MAVPNLNHLTGHDPGAPQQPATTPSPRPIDLQSA